MDWQPSHHHSETGLTAGELLALDCNLTSLCDYIQLEGFNHGSFSDVIVKAMGATYHLHRCEGGEGDGVKGFFRERG
ncbi:hypothetical protein Hanom_Chr11g01045041 [Helianthus anomalus]